MPKSWLSLLGFHIVVFIRALSVHYFPLFTLHYQSSLLRFTQSTFERTVLLIAHQLYQRTVMPHSTIVVAESAAVDAQLATDAAQDSALAHFNSMVEIAILKIFLDYKIFDLIPENGDIEVSVLAQKVGGQHSLLERLSRFLVVNEVLTSPAPGRVAHTLVSKGYRGYGAPSMTLVHFFNFFQLSTTYWPEFFETNGLREPERSNKIPFGLAAGYPDRNLYGILATMPKKEVLFNLTMSKIVRLVSLKGIYDFGWVNPALDPNHSPDRTLIVDVGGGKGQGLKAIFKDFPYIPASRCALVDRPDVLEENARDDEEELRAVKPVEGDMFKEQPVKGTFTPFR